MLRKDRIPKTQMVMWNMAGSQIANVCHINNYQQLAVILKSLSDGGPRDVVEIFPAKTQVHLEMAKMLIQEYAASLGFDLDFQDFQREMATLPGDYAPLRGCLLLAMYHEQPIGCVALRELGICGCEMKRLYVKPHHRGMKAGRALAEAIIDEARRIGYSYMRLDTIPSMRAAINLYKSLGFKEIDSYRYNPIEGASYMELELI